MSHFGPASFTSCRLTDGKTRRMALPCALGAVSLVGFRLAQHPFAISSKPKILDAYTERLNTRESCPALVIE